MLSYGGGGHSVGLEAPFSILLSLHGKQCSGEVMILFRSGIYGLQGLIETWLANSLLIRKLMFHCFRSLPVCLLLTLLRPLESQIILLLLIASLEQGAKDLPTPTL